jgi:glucose-6-phosphate-specific signal transduction histidine kinase
MAVDGLMVIVVGMGAVFLVLWAIMSLHLQLTPGQAILMALFCLVLGIFIEAWYRDTREQLLSGILLLGMIVVWVILKGGKMARKRIRVGGKR